MPRITWRCSEPLIKADKCTAGAIDPLFVYTASGKYPCFQVQTRDIINNTKPETRAFYFVVMCNGVLHEPYLPDFDSSRDFEGDVVHSCNLQDENSLSGQKAPTPREINMGPGIVE